MKKFQILDWHINASMPDSEAILGRIPLLFDPGNPRDADLQLRENYPYGWEPITAEGWTLTADHVLMAMGMEPLQPAAMARLHNETILVFPKGFLCIVRLNGEFILGRIEP